MKLRAALAFALVSAVLASGCSVAESEAATVNGHDIDRSEFERELNALRENKALRANGAGVRTVSSRVAAFWLSLSLQDAVVTAEFRRRHLEVTAADRKTGREQLRSLFQNQKIADDFPDWFIDRVSLRFARAVEVRSALAKVDTSEKGLRAYYDKHLGDFATACVSHILLLTKADADAVAARVKGGEDFKTVAKEKSADQGTKDNGGDLGCITKGNYVPEFEQATFSIPVGKPSDPVQTQFGWHVILVSKREPTPFAEARDAVAAQLTKQGLEVYRKFLDKSLRKADITIDPRYGTLALASGQLPQVVPKKAPAPPDQRPQRSKSTK